MAFSAAIGIAAGAGMAMATKARKQPDVAPPELQDPQPEEAAKKQRRRNKGGRSGTIYTSPAGIETGQTYQGNTLLGG